MTTTTTRHYGLDWLRIGAFGLLILYHIGMFFVPWGWHVKTAEPLDWVAIPMLASNSWRLALLFVVSGYASRILIEKMPGTGRFARDRSARLMIPVIAAMILIVPPQPWIELVTQHGYARDFGWFWLNDYFGFHTISGIDVPTWQHLWFVVYLWAYTLALAGLGLIGIDRFQALFDRLFGGIGLLLIPLGWALVVVLGLARGMESTHALIGDWAGNITYLPAFLFGVGLARSDAALAAARRWSKPSLALALIAYAVVLRVEVQWPGNTPIPDSHADIFSAARATMGWAMIVALIGIADTYWNRDHALRPILTEAVFPFYIIHQTIIVVVGWWLLRFGLHPGGEFAIILAATVAGCWAFYAIGRSLNWLRPLIGLKRVAPTRANADSPVAKEA